MSIHNFAYSAGSLQNDKIESLEKEMESLTRLINLKFNDMSDKLQKFNNLQNVQNLILTTVKQR